MPSFLSFSVQNFEATSKVIDMCTMWNWKTSSHAQNQISLQSRLMLTHFSSLWKSEHYLWEYSLIFISYLGLRHSEAFALLNPPTPSTRNLWLKGRNYPKSPQVFFGRYTYFLKPPEVFLFFFTHSSFALLNSHNIVVVIWKPRNKKKKFFLEMI